MIKKGEYPTLRIEISFKTLFYQLASLWPVGQKFKKIDDIFKAFLAYFSNLN